MIRFIRTADRSRYASSAYNIQLLLQQLRKQQLLRLLRLLQLRSFL